MRLNSDYLESIVGEGGDSVYEQAISGPGQERLRSWTIEMAADAGFGEDRGISEVGV